MGAKATKVGRNQFRKQKADNDKKALAIVQAISANHKAE